MKLGDVLDNQQRAFLEGKSWDAKSLAASRAKKEKAKGQTQSALYKSEIKHEDKTGKKTTDATNRAGAQLKKIVFNKLTGAGQDLASDWIEDNQQATEDDFKQFLNQACNDLALGMIETEPDIKQYFKSINVTDIAGRCADEISSGAEGYWNGMKARQNKR